MNAQRPLDGMPYVPSDRTDIRKTWQRHGWKPEPRQQRIAPDLSYLDDYDRTDRLGYLSAPGGFR